jgi:hypothetical protein
MVENTTDTWDWNTNKVIEKAHLFSMTQNEMV